jgi:hypothetical protein
MLLLCVWSSAFNWVVVRCKNLVVILVLAG